jgi:hypothetical protein
MFPSRRRILQSAALLVPRAILGAGARIAGKDVEIQLTSVTPHTFRLTIQPVVNGKPVGTLVRAVTKRHVRTSVRM